MKNRGAVILALSILIVGEAIPTRGTWQWMLKDTLLFTLIPLASLPFFNIKPREVGLSLNLGMSIKYALAILALAFPVMLYASTLPEFRAYYPLWRSSTLSDFLFFEGAVLFILMFNTEFFFRGFFLFSLEKKLGNVAILLHAIPYAIVHVGKPWPEVPYSFFAGLVFGYIALRTRSILPSFLTHWWGAAIFDALCS
jgi:membrane protease YdiL (CAAX protease family)